VIDWGAVVMGPVVGVFGELITYTPAADSPIYTGAPFSITGIFDEGYSPSDPLADPSVSTAQPRLGVQLSQMPAGFISELAQGDTFTVVRTGRRYIVKLGMDDSHGAARLDANLAP
jgi:hypothetical protein